MTPTEIQRRNEAIRFLNAGIEAAKDKENPQLSHAFQMLSSAVNVDPLFGQGWYQTANALSDMACRPPAIAGWRRALECDNTPAEKAKILINLGWQLWNAGEIEEAARLSDEAVKLAPNEPYGWVNLGIISRSNDASIAATAATAKAYSLAPNDPIVEMAYAFELLFDRQWAKGLKHFEVRFSYKLRNFLHYPYPKWEGEKDKTVFLVADQGLGDTLSFARFVPQAAKRAKFIYAVIQPELLKLFQFAFMKIPNIDFLPSPCNFPAADAWTTFVSLPYALKLTDDEFEHCPGIDLPRYSVHKTWKVPDRKLHIGIAYSGSEQNDINVHRSIPVTRFLDLYKTPGIQLYSLQKDAKAKDLHDQGCASIIKDLSPYISDVCDTISLMHELDLVITIESALGHIAGAAGKECWIPYSFLGRDYRIGLTGENPIWYPKHKIFRQASDLDWKPVFAAMNRALAMRISNGAAAAK